MSNTKSKSPEKLIIRDVVFKEMGKSNYALTSLTCNRNVTADELNAIETGFRAGFAKCYEAYLPFIEYSNQRNDDFEGLQSICREYLQRLNSPAQGRARKEIVFNRDPNTGDLLSAIEYE